MQNPKFLLIFCAVIFGLSTLHAQRADTEAQAKARELLRQKMAELDSPQPATKAPKPAPAAPETKKPRQKTAAAPARKPAPKPEVAPTPAVTPPPAVAAPARPKRPPRVAPPAPALAPAPDENATSFSPDAEAKTREALRQKMAELGSQPKAAPPTATPAAAPQTPVKPTMARKKEKKKEQDVLAIPAPTPPVQSPILAAVPSSKNQKLSELLTLYRSNAITPEEYHKKRAEILAQP